MDFKLNLFSYSCNTRILSVTCILVNKFPCLMIILFSVTFELWSWSYSLWVSYCRQGNFVPAFKSWPCSNSWWGWNGPLGMCIYFDFCFFWWIRMYYDIKKYIYLRVITLQSLFILSMLEQADSDLSLFLRHSLVWYLLVKVVWVNLVNNMFHCVCVCLCVVNKTMV